MDPETKEMWKKVIGWVILYVIILFIATPLFLPYFWPTGPIAWILIFLIGLIFLVRWQLENVAFICPECNYAFRIKTAKEILSPNKFNKKLLRCPGCNERVWCKAVSVRSVEDRIDTPIYIKK